MTHPILNINTYISDGFYKLCDVAIDSKRIWWYRNINQSLMYDRHDSWVYAIVEKDEIVKIGETGAALGIQEKNSIQPQCTTASRLGRYRYFSEGGDDIVRNTLQHSVECGEVSFWAKRCTILPVNTMIAGQVFPTKTKTNKAEELMYLDHIYNNIRKYPKLNRRRG